MTTLQTELDKNSKMYVAVKKIFPLYYVKHANVLKYPLVIWVSRTTTLTVTMTTVHVLPGQQDNSVLHMSDIGTM